MGFEKHERYGKRRHGEYISIRSVGAVYFSVEAYRKWMNETDHVEVLIDRENDRLGFRPVDEKGEGVYTVTDRKVGCRSALLELLDELPDEAFRCPLETSEGYDFPFITLGEDSNRETTPSRSETNESTDEGTSDDEPEIVDDSDEEDIPLHFVKTSQGNLHAPSDESTMQDPDPYCMSRAANWQAKKLDTIPPNFYDHCGQCEDRIAKIEERR